MADADSGETAELTALADAHRWQELDRRIGDRADETARLLRGRLALARGGPIDEALAAARQLIEAQEDDDRHPATVARTAHLLHRHGAARTAGDLLAAARIRWPEHEAFAVDLSTPPEEPEEARALRERRFEEAATTLRARADAQPDGDDAPALRLDAALWSWAGGDSRALDVLRTVRDATADATELARRDVHRLAGRILSALERDSEASETGPRWRFASMPMEAAASVAPSVAALVLRGLGLDDGGAPPAPTMAHLRLSLERRGVVTRRVKADDETLDRALAHGAWIVLEEERPADSGFPLVLGVESVSGLVLLRDVEASAPRLVDRESLRRRTRLFDDAALLVAGVGETGRERLAALDAAGVKESESAIAVDRCLIDEDGGVPPRARIAAMAEAALESAPDVAMLWRVRGEALLESARHGRVQIGAGPVERWYAEVHRRFPECEWPFQLYAQALELTQRWQEAAIAWLDAGARDREDPRNALGAARARIGFGDRRGAERAVRHALSLDPGNVEALARGALLASWRGADDVARLRSDLCVDIAPDDPFAVSVRVTVLERADCREEATALLRRAVRDEDPTSFVGLRLCHRLAHEGEWDEAEHLARTRCEAAPGDPDGWALLTSLQQGRGDAAAALETARAGMRRAGPSRSLVLSAVEVIATLLSDDAASESAVSVAQQVAGSMPDALLDMITRLAERGRLGPALAVSDLATEALPGVADVPWRRAQALLSQPTATADDRRSAAALVERTIAQAEHFGTARVLLGWLAIDEDPGRAAELAAHPTARSMPTMSWLLLAAALEAQGALDDARVVRQRIAGLDPGALGSGLSLLHKNRLLDRAGGVLASLHEASPDVAVVAMYRAMALDEAGGHAEALRRLVALDDAGEGLVPLAVLTTAASRARDCEALSRFAERAFRLGRRVSGGGWQDPWADAGRHAAAAAAVGDPAPRERLFARAGTHPLALWALASIGRRVEASTAVEDGDRLREIAPGAFVAMNAGVEP